MAMFTIERAILPQMGSLLEVKSRSLLPRSVVQRLVVEIARKVIRGGNIPILLRFEVGGRVTSKWARARAGEPFFVC